jgi:hypothetical protein
MYGGYINYQSPLIMSPFAMCHEVIIVTMLEMFLVGMLCQLVTIKHLVLESV